MKVEALKYEVQDSFHQSNNRVQSEETKKCFLRHKKWKIGIEGPQKLCLFRASLGSELQRKDPKN